MTTPSNRTVAQALATALARHGVTLTFGQSIPTAFHLAAPEAGIRQIAYRTENAGGVMADGYSRVARRLAVVTAQNGPAATLLVPPLAEALKASVPILALVQEVPRAAADRNAFQELDHFLLFAGVAKWVRRLEAAERVEDFLDMAVVAATSGRPGPAVLLLPADLLDLPAGRTVLRADGFGQVPLDPVAPDPDRIAAAADLLAAAARPLVIAGGGVHMSGAAKALAALAEAAHLPVATTVMGKGAVDETHPLSVGVVGYFMGPGGATRHARHLVTDADVLFLVGNRTNQNGTDGWSLYPPDARVIHLDIDGQEIGRNHPATVRLVGDARLGLEALTTALAACDLGRRRAARPAVEAAIAAARSAHEAEAGARRASRATPIRPERVMAAITATSDARTIFVADASYASIWLADGVPARRVGQRFLTPRGIAGLGWGLPMALGAKLAEPDAHVVCVAGDGGFAHCWSELETAVRMGLVVTLVVLDNRILGYQKHAELVRFGAHTDAIAFAPVDHAMIARACGCIGVRIDDPDGLEPALAAAARADRTTVIEVATDPDAHPPITAFGAGVPGVDGA
jgi:acetolactate synthase-1/2/3 large subunit